MVERNNFVIGLIISEILSRFYFGLITVNLISELAKLAQGVRLRAFSIGHPFYI